MIPQNPTAKSLENSFHISLHDVILGGGWNPFETFSVNMVSPAKRMTTYHIILETVVIYMIPITTMYGIFTNYIDHKINSSCTVQHTIHPCKHTIHRWMVWYLWDIYLHIKFASSFENHLLPLRSPNSLGFALAAGRRSSLLGPFAAAGPGASILRMDTEALRSWRSRWI